ncbi:MAG: hypothetical protein WBX25_05765 [Rhodomicrobium sp.]
MSELISRRQAFLGLTMMAAPFVIRTPGILMPIRYRPPRIDEKELEWQTILGTRDWKAYPPSVREVREWREGLNGRRGIMVSFTGTGASRLFAMADAEKRYEAMGLL